MTTDGSRNSELKQVRAERDWLFAAANYDTRMRFLAWVAESHQAEEAKADALKGRGFIVFANDTVDEIDEGDEVSTWTAPGLYDALAFAGYARTSDPDTKTFDGCIDLRTDGRTVVIFTTGKKPYEHVLPAEVAEVFLRWYWDNAEAQP
ncbi:hypothetical protein [Micromonospora chokoriensis]|uniref:hypothetical protein n=1 Tax=Micromonospora chokoriensis TaxID=356851 RepID=UPI0004C31212|nr:hypothetical protein [Micromonospora chokoriensis]